MRPTRSSRGDGVSARASLTSAFATEQSAFPHTLDSGIRCDVVYWQRTRDSYSTLMPRKPIALARLDCTDWGSADAVERSYRPDDR